MSLPPPGTVLADKYRLEALLGEGGMGAVFRARHVLMDTPVALKWLRPDVIDSADARERLLREARAVARIRHPNVVHVYDVDTQDGAPFIVMELLEGESFADLIARESLPVSRVLAILIEAMKGLSAAHEYGIIHRDIKPENIFIARDRRHPDGVPKVLDFGISKLADNDERDDRITPTGHSVGTPIFMSVEQLTGTDEVDQRSDVYSFGVVLYRALTGRLPFDGDTFAGIVVDIATSDPIPPKRIRPDLPSSLDQVVMKAIARKRADRYPTIDALIAALRAAEETFGQTPPSVYASVLTQKPPPMPSLQSGMDESADDAFYPYPSGAGRRWTSYVAAAAVGVGLGILGWALLATGPDQPQASQQLPPAHEGAGASAPGLPPALPNPASGHGDRADSLPSGLEIPGGPARAPAAAALSGSHSSPAAKAAATRVLHAPPGRSATTAPGSRQLGKPGSSAATGGWESAKPAKQTKPAKQPKSAQPTKAAQPAASGQPAKSAQPTSAKRSGRSGGLGRDDF